MKPMSVFLVSFFVCSASFCQKGDRGLNKAVYTNPVLNHNFPDPAPILAENGTYYVYGTNTSFEGKMLNIPVATSSDLVSWRIIADAMPVKPKWADSTQAFWAPHVIYDKEKKKYFLYFSSRYNGGMQNHCIGVAVSTRPEGPFTATEQALICGESFINIDPMAFDDPQTGKKLLYWGSAFKAIRVQLLDESRTKFSDDSKMIEVLFPTPTADEMVYERLLEGAWVTYKNGYYYLYISGNNCCGDKANYAVMVARSKTALGPFEWFGNRSRNSSDILEKNAEWLAPGHNGIIEDAAGNEWIIYHAIPIPKDSTKIDGERRILLIDPVTYKDGWPVILNGKPSTGKEIEGPSIRLK